MNDMTLAGIGHNSPPDPLDDAMSPFEDALELSDGMLTGQKVTDDMQMRAVDEVLGDIKEAKKAVEAAKEMEYRPHKDAGDRVIAKYKPTLADLTTRENGLKAMVSDYKVAKRQAEEEAERKARAEADAKRRAAEEAARKADVSDIDAQHDAMMAQREAEDAQRRLVEASKSKTKGLRTFTEYHVLDETILARWIWKNDREFMTGVLADYATRNAIRIPGVVECVKVQRAV